MKQDITGNAKIPRDLAISEGEHIKAIKFLVSANFPIIYITSWEEDRVEEAIRQISKEMNKQVICWSCTSGFTKEGRKLSQNTTDPLMALDYILQESEATSFIFYDFHHYLKPDGDIKYIRKMREVAAASRRNPHTLFLVCTALYIPEELQKDITYVDYPLPNLSEILQLLDWMINEYGKPPVEVRLTNEEKEEIAKAALGLTLAEAEKAFSKSLVNDLQLTIQDIQEVLDEKAQVIKKTQMLEYFPPVENFGVVGGLELLLQWLSRRREAFTEAAADYGLPAPKGILVVGMPGCGKSLCAKAVSAEWRLPLLRLDMARIFGVVGVTPEENLRKAIKTAETISPCVFWVDEIEKGFPKTVATASDVSVRLLGHFLTWMQEKTLPVFVFATANDINNIPPELLRRGRFDDIFFVDYPNPNEREAIWRIQFKKHRQTIPEESLEELVRESRGFSGAEIEQCLIDALFQAFSDNKRHMEINDLREAVSRMKPLSESMREELSKMRDAAQTCAVPASTHVAEAIGKFDVGLGREISRRRTKKTDS